ncbi:HK97 family phage prohead protease [Fictibacillus nanhaiensis]|uniref:HK97 family phage prohead protease n=1 Tax=Fictibacillus nanhaiensis TaxID=742169 RepID=UPI00203B6D28|nr:HK97 family phage prohead protease [Fictibacillus nanhaiensis]MCM3730064.1 HK97 family phage prohead protease [Fictibacillus nanhaiensis]
MSKQKELRNIDIDSIEIRSVDEQENLIEGYINKFNSDSQFMGFFEQVDRNAFNRTLSDGHNIMGLYNHDSAKVLGSTKTGSLQLHTDEVGLRFSLKINPNVSYAKDVYELVRSGDVDGCSFGFYVLDDEWTVREDGTELRVLKDIELIEVTITPFPAYTSSEANCRSYDNYIQDKQAKEDLELRQKQIVIELELM